MASMLDSGQLAAIAVAGASALAALASATVAIFTLRRTRRAQGAQQLYALMREWESSRMKGMRRRVAEALLKTPPLVDDETVELLNFFEMVGFMVNTVRVVDLAAAWGAFSDFLCPYFEPCRGDITAYRESDATYWEEVVRLQDQMMRLTAKRLEALEWPVMSSMDPRPREPLYATHVDPQDVERFLQSERRLPDDRIPLEANARVTELPPVSIRHFWRKLVGASEGG